MVRWKEYETGFSDKAFVDKVLKDVHNSKERKSKGKEYKSAVEMTKEYEISMDQLKQLIVAEKDAGDLEKEGFVLSGNVKVLENGNVGRGYSRAGELMVQAIEDAYKELGFTVPITGEYLLATPDEGWAGSH